MSSLAAVGSPRHAPVRPRQRPVVADLIVLGAGLGLGIAVGVTLTAETRAQYAAAGGGAIFWGNLTGLVGTYLALLMVLLISRIPPVERVLGQDRLLGWHRRLAPWPLTLIAAHAVLTTVGFAQAARAGIGQELGAFLASYPGMLAAIIGFLLMIGIGVISARVIRSRLARETWWLLHLGMYLALALAFAHVLWVGQSFVGHPLTRLVWSLVWASTAGLVLLYRVGLPILRTARHRLVVAEVVAEAPGVVSVICRGRRLDRLPVAGGQFLVWRFLARGIWWQGHPYSLSALPDRGALRLTVKTVGDHSGALATLQPGTRVAIEGPYGAFTQQSQRHPRALLIAGGIGVTAVRSLLEDLPARSQPIVVLRASRPEQLVFAEEVAELTRRRRGTVHECVGERAVFTPAALGRFAPDLCERDVYVCGPEGFVAQVVVMVRSLGVADSAIHREVFAW